MTAAIRACDFSVALQLLNRTLLTILFALLPAAALAKFERMASAESPNKVLKVELHLHEGQLHYSIKRLGRTLIGHSRLGFVLQDAEKLERNLGFVSAKQTSHDETWLQPWGESLQVRDHYQQITARFQEQTRGKRFFDVSFKLYDDGIGFRYEFPKQSNVNALNIIEEQTEFNVLPKAQAWWIKAGEWNRYEYLYQRTALSEVGRAHTPMTIRTHDGIHIAFHEAALVDYSSMWLQRVEGQKLRAQLSPSSDGIKVKRQLPFHTPWRTLQISDRAGGLAESNLILNLNEPNKLGDVSWFKPHKYVGIWWGMHLDSQSWASGPKHGATTANAKSAIDFASKYGFRGVLIEGWNKGWDGDWFANGWDFSFTEATPDFDFKAVTDYAHSKNVHIIGHHETACAVSHYERQMDAAFAMYAKAGVDAIKTGYVCDAGQIERQDQAGGPVIREWHDGQWMSNHHLRVVQEAAKYKIAINAHEPIKDTGLRRTYPNWVAREGARGMEYNAWGNPPNPPEHEVNLVFTRMLAGPMDFTPGVISLRGRNGQKFQSTLVKQLAQFVVLYSPVQMAADLPEHYLANEKAFQFIKDVPADWRETKVLNGEVGDFVTIARKDRNTDDWYVGAVTDEFGRSLTIDLGFLDADKTYAMQLYRDGDNAHYKGDQFAFDVEKRNVTRDETLQLKLAPGGGTAIRFQAIMR
jgi:alpha-glucosidase